MEMLTQTIAQSLLPARPADSNKSTFGKVLNIAGSMNYRGAAYLSSIAALKVGSGYATLACIPEVANSVAALCPDIVMFPLMAVEGSIDETESEKILGLVSNYSVLSVGSGLSSLSGTNNGIKQFFAVLMKGLSKTIIPVIIDADGLNFLADLQPIPLPKNKILTPHPRELSRLMGATTEEIQSDRITFANLASEKFSSVIVLKGHKTVITDGEKTFVNTTGNSALAKAGTGDVLTGMIAGLCAQGLRPFDAAVLAVYLHGIAGELASRDLTEYGVLASDLLRYIPLAINLVAGESS